MFYWLFVANDANRLVPFWLFSSKQISINFMLYLVHDSCCFILAHILAIPPVKACLVLWISHLAILDASNLLFCSEIILLWWDSLHLAKLRPCHARLLQISFFLLKMKNQFQKGLLHSEIVNVTKVCFEGTYLIK